MCLRACSAILSKSLIERLFCKALYICMLSSTFTALLVSPAYTKEKEKKLIAIRDASIIFFRIFAMFVNLILF